MNPWESNYKTHQGNFGLGRAIAYYIANCIPVMIPLNDAQKYDLVVDKDGKLCRVSVKTTQSKSKSDNFIVQMKNITLGADHNTIRKFDNTSCEIVFVTTIDGDLYEIPSSEINVTCQLTLTEDYDKYKIVL